MARTLIESTPTHRQKPYHLSISLATKSAFSTPPSYLSALLPIRKRSGETRNMKTLSSSSSSFVFSFSLLLLLLVVLTSMADKGSGKDCAVHIVYTQRPEGEEPEAHDIRTLSSVLGSEDAAKKALIYSYKSAASGFSAKLTPEQVSEMSKQPDVIQVVPSRTYQLHSGPSVTH